ncbi:hypothetical protein Lesp02_75080 [Lentzea sp. NBRC 105346]|uniref:hypothetical protein n=1 Tax=Lentzea sp. NBRC 105346 TaxID=3032205 RepID=UPI0024A186B5|nr:hypothetical protein [Lentzea sp. NBRC 105346]GLZ35321.1 hypothetical protein Lesp02_75080 [Lentzea sp. NBRC 105346]
MQRGQAAYHCPAGHGLLRVWPDTNAPVGVSLVCTKCGHRIAGDTTLIELAANTAPDMDPEPVPIVRLPDGTVPQGLRPDSAVRTTGWLQLGKLPVSSGFWAAAAAFCATAPLYPWLPFVATPLGYLAWKQYTTHWLPASQAVNMRRTAAEELNPGQHVRLYGTAGPVGEVGAVGADAQGQIRLRMVGGTEIIRRPGQRVWQADLRN